MKFLPICLAAIVSTTAAIAQTNPPLGSLPALPNTHPQADAIISLGRQLYFDPRLSGDSSTSCAECHNPAFGFGDGGELSRGYPGTKHWRNAQTIVNSSYLTGGLHWDGTVPSLLHQVPGAMGTSIVANIDTTLAEERLRQVPEYLESFREIWDEEPNIDRIAEAIAAYEGTLVSIDSPFDLFASGQGPLSDEATRGYFLFTGKAGCINCHNGALATDEDFHNTSVPPNPEFTSDPLLQVTFRVMMRGFGLAPEVYEGFDRDPGRYAVTKDPADLGKLRTPPLRYLTHTAPYMHNGMFYTLEEVVDFYNAGGTEDVFGTKSPLIKPLGLTEAEEADLVAFLASMSGPAIEETFPELPGYEAGAFPARPDANLANLAAAPAPKAPAPAAEPAAQPAAASSGLNFGSSDGLSFGETGSGGLQIDLSDS